MAKLKPGMMVVYRLVSYYAPRLGRLCWRNTGEKYTPHFEQGAWVVEADHDGRRYCVSTSQGGGFRVATQEDLDRYAERRSSDRKRARETDRMAAFDSFPIGERIEPVRKHGAPKGASTEAVKPGALSELVSKEIEKAARQGANNGNV